MEMKNKSSFLDQRIKRRTLLSGAATAAAILVQTSFGKMLRGTPQMPPAGGTASDTLLETGDPTRRLGAFPGKLGSRSSFENPQKLPSFTSSRASLQDLYGMITPSDLHFERHHAGIPVIDPEKQTIAAVK